MALELFTIGHSTHPLETFLGLLSQHHIELLADIRRFPGSRKFPHFNRENLSVALRDAEIDYQWIEALGGRRHKGKSTPSKNLGLRNESFRNYADYMTTPEFRAGIDQLLQYAQNKRTAFMCSESVFWRCHRRLVSDYLLTQGMTVEHIMPSGDLHLHALTSGANLVHGELIYLPPASNQNEFQFE